MADIDVNYLSEAINDKMDRDAHNIQSPSAVVIAKQDPTEGNNWSWYKLYSDGWVEQGGKGYGGNAITLPKAMADTNYTVLSVVDHTESSHSFNSWIGDKTTTTITIKTAYGDTQYNYNVIWQVSGKSKQN